MIIMGNSFQDQLLQSGLVDKKSLNKSKKEKYQKRKTKGKNRVQIDEQKLQLQQQEKKKKEYDKLLNAKREELKQEKALRAQIKQLVEMNQLPQAVADKGISYHFSDQGKVKKVLLSPTHHQQLTDGILAIAKIEDSYAVIPSTVAEKIISRNVDCIIVRNDKDETTSADDDLYAEYQIPDDLIW